jgi:hypothetical protein
MPARRTANQNPDYFGDAAKAAYQAALLAIARVAPGPLTKTPLLTFGGVSRYGRVLAYYSPATDAIVVPTGNVNLSIAALAGGTTDPIVWRDQRHFVQVLTHELMHSVDNQLYGFAGGDPHGSEGWCRQVVAFEKLADPALADLELGMMMTLIAWAREMRFKPDHPAGALRAFALRYYPPIDAAGAILPTPSALPDLFADAVTAYGRSQGRVGKPCIQCGDEFFPTRRDAVYCSTKCRTAAHREAGSDELARRKSERHAAAVKKAQSEVDDTKSELTSIEARMNALLARKADVEAKLAADVAALNALQRLLSPGSPVARTATPALRRTLLPQS